MIQSMIWSETSTIDLPDSKRRLGTFIFTPPNGLDHLFRRKGIFRFQNRRKNLEEIEGELYSDPFIIDRISEGR